jgi:hypothetical protein
MQMRHPVRTLRASPFGPTTIFSFETKALVIHKVCSFPDRIDPVCLNSKKNKKIKNKKIVECPFFIQLQINEMSFSV